MITIDGYQFEEGLYYDEDHGWVRIDEDIVTIGVTDFFQKLSGEIVFVELPLIGRKFEKGQPYSSIESGKWVGRLKSPLSGEIVEVNSELQDFPYIINEDPYGDGWVIKLKPDSESELEKLFIIDDKFEVFIKEEKKRIDSGKGD